MFASHIGPCLVLTALQFLLALPWLWAIDPKTFRDFARRPTSWATFIGIVGAIAALAAFMFAHQRVTTSLDLMGRFYGSILFIQVEVDLFLLVFGVMLSLWPKGGA